MLRNLRIILATICFSLITLLFLDFSGTLHTWFGWLAKIQFIPALLALNTGIVILLVLVTLLFGRIYCSIICPLGIFQDIISRINTQRKKKKYRFSYSPALSWLRYTLLGIFLFSLLIGIGALTALLDPYSAYGRIAQNLFSPVWIWMNNGLALLAEHLNSYAFYSVDVWIKGISTLVIALITIILLIILAWKNGRTYCNTICPVGTLLGLLSRYSLFRPTIDKEKCNNCTLCTRQCKASCINSEKHEIDYSRCVVCMDCIQACRHNAIQYKLRKRKIQNKEEKKEGNNATRKSFLSGIGILASTAALKAQEKKVDGGLAVILDKKIPNRLTPIVPPGAKGIRHLTTHCTGCQLCVTVCSNHVLRPSTELETLMQPRMSYERGYCRPECVKCSEVCPSGAIIKISPAEKSAIQIGHAVWIKENCIPLTDGVTCGNCARHCPSGAITMIPSDPNLPDSPKIPAINIERCIGCGACENLCPARPFSAIYVEGHKNHRTI